MTLKKQYFAEGETSIFNKACIQKRGEYWYFCISLRKEKKYTGKSLSSPSETIAIENCKVTYLDIYANLLRVKNYFSITTKEDVDKYFMTSQKLKWKHFCC